MSSDIQNSIPPILSSMVQLGPAIFLKDFPQAPQKHDKPLTIVLLFWMNAPLRPAAKYISEYGQLAPDARIIAIFTSASDFFIRNSDGAQRRRITPVLDALLSTAKDGDGGSLYVHAFSNGGCTTLRYLAVAYRDATGKPLPANAMLIDSAPGITSMSRAVKALSYSFPRFFLWRVLLSTAVWGWLLVLATLGWLSRRKHPSYFLREGLNDQSLIRGKVERCYVYSKEDDLIYWKDVEEHAGQARARGWNVSREVFEDSPHVGHMRTDPQRYWKIVARLLKIAMA
ncbi:predicted protein [Uncinocarpus reesii 1704]|uniref:Indole-diterpene biosynthesis protein PaxU n=1 Tax=Uncinocarpus reesii (strain UAMH 1704) TaxID=336963 RepID=C4JMS7_UNCRE|nr:uncharacterized protein UREG_04135 [Uncinocarpus reesii 1704]EEP79289.1 predicted protein [Uncinocarpus reesii 1704]